MYKAIYGRLYKFDLYSENAEPQLQMVTLESWGFSLTVPNCAQKRADIFTSQNIYIKTFNPSVLNWYMTFPQLGSP